jgi:hypothetical protein
MVNPVPGYYVKIFLSLNKEKKGKKAKAATFEAWASEI